MSRYLTYSTRAIPGARRVDDGAGVDFGSREEPSRALCDQHGDGQGIGATTGRVSGGRTGTVRACPPARCMCCGRLRAGGRVQSRQQRYGPGREAGSGAAPRRKYNRDLPTCERTRGLPTSAWPLTRRLGPAADRGARARAAPRRGARASRPSRSGVSRHDGVTTTELGVTTTELGAALARRGRARWPLPTMGDKWENAETGGAEAARRRAEEARI